MAKIDVVIPCYNYGRFLPRCVQSVLDQSVIDLRVLIIDDASTDNSQKICRMLEEFDRRVQVISHAHNRGHIATYNEGIEWAESEYFLLLSADDLLVPGAFDRAIRVMDANRDIVLTYGDCITWFDYIPLPKVGTTGPFTWTRTNLIREMCTAATNIIPTPTAIARTSVQKKIGGYRPTLPHAGDLEMWLRFAAHGEVARIHSVQGVYRKHGTAMSNAYWDNILSDYRQRKAAFDAFFDQYGGEFDRYGGELANVPSLRGTTYRVLAGKAFQSGLGYIRRGRVRGGIQLLRWAMSLDRRLRYLPPLWRLVKMPGPEGRRWALGALKRAAHKLTDRIGANARPAAPE